MRAVIYTRISRSEQEEDCRPLVESQGYAVRPEDVLREPESDADPEESE